MAASTSIPLSEYLTTTYRPDTLRSQRDRVEDYLAMGVAHIWLVDPVTREAWTATTTGYNPLLTGEFTVPGNPIHVPLASLFTTLDKMQTPR